MLVARNYPPSNLARLLPASALTKSGALREGSRDALGGRSWSARPELRVGFEPWRETLPSEAHPEARDPLYLFGCQVEWEKRGDPSAAWEVISAARSSHTDTRAQARSMLERSLREREKKPDDSPEPKKKEKQEQRSDQNSTAEARMRTPYSLEIIESCMNCKASREGFFCRFSQPVLRTVDAVSHHTAMPAGALLFIEGQTPRGLFVLCSGKVKLYTTSKDGKLLILKQAEAGEVLGLSAVIAGTNYEMTAETALPCQLNFIGRQDFMTLLHHQTEVGMQASLRLSRDFQVAYRDIHDLVLARSSTGKLARLLLSNARSGFDATEELRLRYAMTHEEMAQRIGSSRETVTRLLSDLKRKRLIRLEGETLIIRDRTGLEALVV